MPRTWKSRPQDPQRPPTTLTEIARRYHGAALALSKTLGLPLADVLKEYSAAVSCVFIEAGRASVIMPGEVKLPALGQRTDLTSDHNDSKSSPVQRQVPVADPKPATPPVNGHPPTEGPAPPKDPKPKRDSEAVMRSTLLGAIEDELFTHTEAGQLKWRPGRKAMAEVCFTTVKWAEIKRLDVPTLQTGYAKLQQRQVAERLAEPLEDDGPDVPLTSSKVSPPKPEHPAENSAAADLAAGKGAVEMTSPSPPSSSAAGDEATAKAALKLEALGWGLPSKEVEDTLKRYHMDRAKEILWRAKSMRAKTAKGALV